MNSPPRKMAERGLFAPVWREFNRLIDFCREIQVTSVRNGKLTRTMNGTMMVGETGGESAPAQAPTNITQMRVKSVADDHLVCVKWTEAVLGGSLDEIPTTDSLEGRFEEIVAKPWRLRKTPFHGRTVRIPLEFSPFAMTVQYNYLGASARNATKLGEGIVEKQYIVPRYVTGDVIFVGTADATGIPGVNYVDINVDGRAWSAHLTEP